MANIASFVEPRFLNGEMLGQSPQVITIKSAKIEDFDDGQKVIIQFYEVTKSLCANKSNLRTLSDLFGPETETWAGNKIMAYGERLTSGQFSGKWTVKITAAPKLAAPASQAAQPQAQAAPEFPF